MADLPNRRSAYGKQKVVPEERADRLRTCSFGHVLLGDQRYETEADVQAALAALDAARP